MQRPAATPLWKSGHIDISCGFSASRLTVVLRGTDLPVRLRGGMNDERGEVGMGRTEDSVNIPLQERILIM